MVAPAVAAGIASGASTVLSGILSYQGKKQDYALFASALQNSFIPYELNETNVARLLTLPPLEREKYYSLFRNLNGMRFMD